jgi:hypothetical protein
MGPIHASFSFFSFVAVSSRFSLVCNATNVKRATVPHLVKGTCLRSFRRVFTVYVFVGPLGRHEQLSADGKQEAGMIACGHTTSTVVTDN